MVQHTNATQKTHPARWIAGSMAVATVGSLIVLFVGQEPAVSKEPATTVRLQVEATNVLTSAVLGADDKSEKGTGTFKGVVTFEGKIPSRRVIHAKGDATVKDPQVCAVEDMLGEEFIVNEKAGNAVPNVVIFLKKVPAGYKPGPVPKEPAVFDQKGCKFVPHILAVRCNQEILLKNDDPVSHNTKIDPSKNTGGNPLVAANDRAGVPWKYTKPENLPIPVSCSLHPWMKAYHFPLDHGFVAVTDEEGKFEIKGLPPGKHVFTVWTENGFVNGYNGKEQLAIEIKADEVVDKKLSFNAKQFQLDKK
jgi:hypothetical protein